MLESNRELFTKLRILLAPQGIITFTTGTDEVGQFLQSRYGSFEVQEVYTAWRGRLEKELEEARLVIIGMPMDAGACFERGSFKAPIVLRNHMILQGFYEEATKKGWVDVGDIYVNPGLIDDSYYNEELLEEVRVARRTRLKGLDPEAYELAQTWKFPVAPHSAYREALSIIAKITEQGGRNATPVFTLGGDHSISRIPVLHLTEDIPELEKGSLGILHFDAHTDLLDRRDGTPFNYATWAYHANDAIGRGKRLVQVGVRVSGWSAQEWEERLDLIQLRPEHLGDQPDPIEWGHRLVENWKKVGVKYIYVSNDIDGTDPIYAGATGTSEKGGLTPEFVSQLIRTVGEELCVIGGDIVEVAPPLSRNLPGEPEKTIKVSYDYITTTLEAMERGQKRINA